MKTIFTITLMSLVEVSYETEQETPRAAVLAAIDASKHDLGGFDPRSWPIPRPESVEWEGGNVQVVGFCEGCDKPILEGEDYASGQEGCNTCRECLPE